MASSVYRIVTDSIVEELKAGTVPWRRPWATIGNTGGPVNLVSNRPYRGINTFLLGLTAHRSPYWVTYKQAQQLGGQVRKGEKSSVAIFWKMQRFAAEVENADRDIVETMRDVPILRYYRVFNTDQCDGLASHKRIKAIEAATPPAEWEAIQDADALIRRMPNAPQIRHLGDRAFYRPGDDSVTLPEPGLFEAAGDYYAVALHELTHSTGHRSRLDRHGLDEYRSHHFGDANYSREELVAEMGSAMLCAVSGIENTIANSAAYVQSWINALKGDERLAVVAAARAQKAADYIRGETATVEAAA